MSEFTSTEVAALEQVYELCTEYSFSLHKRVTASLANPHKSSEEYVLFWKDVLRQAKYDAHKCFLHLVRISMLVTELERIPKLFPDDFGERVVALKRLLRQFVRGYEALHLSWTVATIIGSNPSVLRRRDAISVTEFQQRLVHILDNAKGPPRIASKKSKLAIDYGVRLARAWKESIRTWPQSAQLCRTFLLIWPELRASATQANAEKWLVRAKGNPKKARPSRRRGPRTSSGRKRLSASLEKAVGRFKSPSPGQEG